VFDSWLTCGGKNSLKFERSVVVKHRSSPWILGEEEGLFGDLTGRSSGRWSDECGLAVSGSSGDFRSGKSEFLCKRNPKEDDEWMRRWIMRLRTPFIGQSREGRRYCGGEIVDFECSYSMLPF
jgi:hypothetical protein